MLAIHFFAIQTISEASVYLPAYLAKSFDYLYEIGVAGTGFGIIFVLGQFFWAIPLAFIVSSVVAMTVFFFVRINIDETNKAKKKEPQ